MEPELRSEMSIDRDGPRVILVVEEVEETRDGIERLLRRDGHRVRAVRDPADAVENAQREAPDLILARLDGSAEQVIGSATSIRVNADLSNAVPVVAFCATCVPEGVEERVGDNVYVISPENFDQLRRLIAHLLAERPPQR
jgi:CheY-like chemotaxis protein